MVEKQDGKDLASWVSLRTELPHWPGLLTPTLLTGERERSLHSDVSPCIWGVSVNSSFAAVLTNTHTLDNNGLTTFSGS